MKTFTKAQLIDQLKTIVKSGWIESTSNPGDAAIGRTLEDCLGIEENNLPIPNASEWELKAKRLGSRALTTLVHPEPSPRAVKIVPSLLLPNYGWPHKSAGLKYPENEMSLRLTLKCDQRTDRGFTFAIDRENERIMVSFDHQSVGEHHNEWMQGVKRKVGLGDLNPNPYWGFEDLYAVIRRKLTNCFFVEGDKKKINGIEHFWYRRVTMLESFNFEKFLTVASEGGVAVDFDARTGHNHGTKFRVESNRFSDLYERSAIVIDDVA